ncbi:MAG TPA: hypothetical protein PKL98_00065 [Candidatus Pacearchaeota archaeon]|nr:hypothetical protein [Candidatus Pacearchaeota archaeon]
MQKQSAIDYSAKGGFEMFRRSEENDFDIVSLIPKNWNLEAKTKEEIIFFGRATIRQMIRYWRDDASTLARRIKNIDKKLNLIKYKNAADISKIAEQYENPDLSNVDIRKDNFDKIPEPIDSDSMKRKGGATTFNFCGWCKYANPRTKRFSYCISGYCGFKKDANLYDNIRFFNTPCFLKKASNDEFKKIRNGLIQKKRQVIEEKKIIDQKIKKLLVLEKCSEEKPVITICRPGDWFNINDSVVCYIKKMEGRTLNSSFAIAKVINGYRHHNGCVSVRYEEQVHMGENLEGHGGWYEISCYEIIHSWEFDYLIKHPEFAEFWIKQHRQYYRVDSEKEKLDIECFLKALTTCSLSKEE